MKKRLFRASSLLLALLLLAALLPARPVLAAGTAELPVKDWPAEAWEVLRLTNKERMANGLDPLATSVLHQRAAGVRAGELVTDYRADHTRPDGSKCYTALDEQGITYWSAGENIAQGQRSPQEVVTAWMNSAGHRANILRDGFTMMGAGYAEDGFCWCQDFTGPDRGFSSMELAVDGAVIPVNGVLDTLGIVVILHGESWGDSYLPLTEEMCSWAGSSAAGDYGVTVSCKGLSASFTVTVSEAPSSPSPSEGPQPPVSGSSVTEGDWQAAVSGGKATITAYTGQTGADVALTIPDKVKGYEVTGVGPAVFQGKTFFSVSFPASLRSIGDSAFASCGCQGPLILPEGLESIGSEAFYSASFTGRVYIPASVKKIGTYAFSYLRSVTDFAVAPSNQSYCSYGGALFNKDKTVLYNFPLSSELESYVTPETVELLYCTAFANARLQNLYVTNSTAGCMSYTFYWTSVNVWCRGSLSSDMIGLNAVGRVYAPLPCDIREVSESTLSAAREATAAHDRAVPMEPEKQREAKPVSNTSHSIRAFFFGDGDFSYASQATVRNGDIAVIQNNPYSIRTGSAVKYQIAAREGSRIVNFRLLDEQGKDVPFTESSSVPGLYSFTMPDSTVFACVKAENADYVLPQLPFTDVSSKDYFFDPVAWALQTGVTTGTTETTFSPEATCTRAQVVTFLWRAMGCPEPKNKSNPFKDVYATDYFYKPVLWAVEKGITNGTSATAFSPYMTCTVAHIVTFICRAMGQDYQVEGKPWYWRADAFIGNSHQMGPRYVLEDPCPRSNVVLYLFRCHKELEYYAANG